MLTFVVAGGGFSGTEVAAALNDFVRRAVGDYRSIPPQEVRVVLVHSGSAVLERELTPRLAAYATAALAEQGIELMLGERLVAASPQSAVLSDGRRISTRTLISTVPSSPNPIVERLGLADRAGPAGVRRDAWPSAGADCVWAVGDCGLIPMPGGEPVPADRPARHSPGEGAAPRTSSPPARARGHGRSRSPASASSARSATTARSPSCPAGCTSRGLPAWLMWRGIYWSKLPGASSQGARGDLVAERPGAPAPPGPAQPGRRPRRHPGPLRAGRDRLRRRATPATACS